MGSKLHDQIDAQRTRCHRCGYELQGFEEGAPCPECGTPFDQRPDVPGAWQRVRRGVIYIVLAMLVMPVLMPLAFLFYFLAIRIHYWLKNAPRHGRLSYRIRQRHRLIQLLMYIWFIEFVAAMWLDEIWPPFLDWW
ncbi:MAG: hypothetical protein ACF8K1_04155 [Phycisphaerales bacterium JB047]